MGKIRFFAKGMAVIVLFGFLLGGSFLFNACTKTSGMDEQRLLQIEEGRKFAKVLKNTNVKAAFRQGYRFCIPNWQPPYYWRHCAVP